jgi:hypothetical protein
MKEIKKELSNELYNELQAQLHWTHLYIKLEGLDGELYRVHNELRIGLNNELGKNLIMI